MILVIHFRYKKRIVAVVGLLLILVLLNCLGNLSRRWNSGPVTEVKVYPAVSAAIFGEIDNNQDENILPDGQLPKHVIDGVEKFVFFLGWARSGHSIVGSLMDAHPNMVIANECTIFRNLASNSIRVTKEAIFDTLYQHSTSDLKARRTKGTP